MPEKKIETKPAVKPKKSPAEIIAEEHAAYMEMLKTRGAMLCPDCNGLGFTRPKPGKHVDCPKCKGTGSIPLPDGAMDIVRAGDVLIQTVRLAHAHLYPSDLAEKVNAAGAPFLSKLEKLDVPRKRARQLLDLPPEQEAPKA